MNDPTPQRHPFEGASRRWIETTALAELPPPTHMCIGGEVLSLTELRAELARLNRLLGSTS